MYLYVHVYVLSLCLETITPCHFLADSEPGVSCAVHRGSAMASGTVEWPAQSIMICEADHGTDALLSLSLDKAL